MRERGEPLYPSHASLPVTALVVPHPWVDDTEEAYLTELAGSCGADPIVFGRPCGGCQAGGICDGRGADDFVERLNEAHSLDALEAEGERS